MSEDWGAADDTAPVVVAPEVQDIKLFGKWSTDDVQVSDISLTVSQGIKLTFFSSSHLTPKVVGNFKSSTFTRSLGKV